MGRLTACCDLRSMPSEQVRVYAGNRLHPTQKPTAILTANRFANMRRWHRLVSQQCARLRHGHARDVQRNRTDSLNALELNGPNREGPMFNADWRTIGRQPCRAPRPGS